MKVELQLSLPNICPLSQLSWSVGNIQNALTSLAEPVTHLSAPSPLLSHSFFSQVLNLFHNRDKELFLEV